MWTKLTGDMGKPLFVNLRQISVIRQPAQGSPGARMALLGGSAMPVRQSADMIIKMLVQHPKEEVGLWLRLMNEFGKPVAANFGRARAVLPGPKDFGGSMLVFLPSFSFYVQESLEEIGKLMDRHPNAAIAGSWVKLRSDQRKWVLVNAATIALVRKGPRRSTGSFLTFLGGGQRLVRESPDKILHMIGVEHLPAAEKRPNR